MVLEHPPRRATRFQPADDAYMIGPYDELLTVLRKDLRLELRTWETLPAMVLFALVTFVIFHFGLNRQAISGQLPPEYAGQIQQYYINIARGRPAASTAGGTGPAVTPPPMPQR